MDDIRLVYTLESPGQNICEKPLTEKSTSTLTLIDTHIGENACVFGYNQAFGVEWRVTGKAENLLFQESLLPSPALNTLCPHLKQAA